MGAERRETLSIAPDSGEKDPFIYVKRLNEKRLTT